MEPGKHEQILVSFKIWNRETDQVELYSLKRYVIEGERDGPHVVVNAGSHGDEFLAIDAAKEAYERLTPGDVKGTVSFIPEANIFAARHNTRETPSPEFETYVSEERNLNRCFNRFDLGEEPQGNITERLAYHILQLVVKADYCMDLHTATRPSYKIDQIRSKTDTQVSRAVKRQQERMVHGSGLPYVVKTEASTIGNGILAGEAPRRGTPAVTVEIGSGPYAEEELNRYVDVVMNLLKTTDALDGEPETVNQDIFRDLRKVAAPTAGQYTRELEEGDRVRSGETLGVIENDEGRVEVTCPWDGMVESVHQEDWVHEGTRISFIATNEELGVLEAIVRGTAQATRAFLDKLRETMEQRGA